MRYTVTGTLHTYERRGDGIEPVARETTRLVSGPAGLTDAEVLDLALAALDDPEAEWADDAAVESESPAAVMRASGAPMLFDEAR